MRAIDVVENIGLYEGVSEQDCQEGTPLGHAYEQGWNAALTEVLGRLKAAQRRTTEGGAP